MARMFDALPESRIVQRRGPAATVPAFLVHGGIVLLLVHGSTHAAPPPRPLTPEAVVFQQRRPEPRPTTPPDAPLPAPPVLKAIHIPTAPVTIPSVLPAIDLRHALTAPDDYGPRPTVPRGRATAQTEAAVDPAEAVLMPWEVDRAVSVVAGSAAPQYPDLLRRARVEGEVLVSFEVDTLGRADMRTFTVIRATHELFARSVRDAVARQRFLPAEAGTRKVRQRVEQPFTFSIMPPDGERQSLASGRERTGDRPLCVRGRPPFCVRHVLASFPAGAGVT
jgi:protein TonB